MAVSAAAVSRWRHYRGDAGLAVREGEMTTRGTLEKAGGGV